MTVLIAGFLCGLAILGIGVLLGRMGSQLNRRPARGAPHCLWRDIYPNPPGTIASDCRCIIGRDHWPDGRPV